MRSDVSVAGDIRPEETREPGNVMTGVDRQYQIGSEDLRQRAPGACPKNIAGRRENLYIKYQSYS